MRVERRVMMAVAALSLIEAWPCGANEAAEPASLRQGWKRVRALAGVDAGQAAVADEKHLFGVSNRRVTKYDRETGAVLGRSRGDAKHLNSGVMRDGKVYLAHSNYPSKPDRSDIRVLDPESMELTMFHDFGESDGSLTWAIPTEDGWWCHFAYYGAEHDRSYLSRFDRDWNETGRWRFPPEALASFGEHSASGGVFLHGYLVVTGHDEREALLLEMPGEGKMLQLVRKVPVPFAGQGIAVDPVTGGLVGIDRGRRELILAE